MKKKIIKRSFSLFSLLSLSSLAISSCGVDRHIPRENKAITLNSQTEVNQNPIDLILPKIFATKDSVFISDWKVRQQPTNEWLNEFKGLLKDFGRNRTKIKNMMREKWYYFLSNISALTWGYSKVEDEIFHSPNLSSRFALSQSYKDKKQRFNDNKQTELKSDVHFNKKFLEDARIPVEVSDAFLTYYLLVDKHHFILLNYDFTPTSGTGEDGRPIIDWNLYRFQNNINPNIAEYETIKHIILAHPGDVNQVSQGFARFEHLAQIDGLLLKYELKGINLGLGAAGSAEVGQEDNQEEKPTPTIKDPTEIENTRVDETNTTSSTPENSAPTRTTNEDWRKRVPPGFVVNWN
ncbi:hypothetical protein [Mycoplasma sp. E35C]|uniref:hypothetical protein n=1 Tax=Mycoplasma sp. E35C TaxID=2801918 RepID=UPI001CA434F8|nr:hypothetical protein [Mycoplasma sp. E35C]QZX48972.1 hypothetical protein JJE79_02860 [Mycoplasma sp. E35C]